MENALDIQELVDTIVYHIRDDQVSLRMASSINRTFHASCTSHLFRSITLRFEPIGPRSASRILLFHSILTAAPHIALLVQTLRISSNFCLPQREEETRDASIPHILNMLTSLSSIEFHHLTLHNPRIFNEGIWKNLPPVLKNSLPSLLVAPRLCKITFKNLTGIPLGLLRPCTGLKNVQLIKSSIDNKEFASLCDIPTSHSLQLESLSIFCPPFLVPRISDFGGPQSPFDLSNLRTLNTFVELSSHDKQLQLWEFIRPLKAHIECLGLRARKWSSIFLLPEPLHLEELTSLRSLHLVCTLEDDRRAEVGWLKYLLTKFVIPAPVEEITVTFKFQRAFSIELMVRESSQATWEALDNTVHNAIFPFLSTFTINLYCGFDRSVPMAISDADLKTIITLRMPHLRRKGILNVILIAAMPPDFALTDE